MRTPYVKVLIGGVAFTMAATPTLHQLKREERDEPPHTHQEERNSPRAVGVAAFEVMSTASSQAYQPIAVYTSSAPFRGNGWVVANPAANQRAETA
jgi:hypothetical protein